MEQEVCSKLEHVKHEACRNMLDSQAVSTGADWWMGSGEQIAVGETGGILII